MARKSIAERLDELSDLTAEVRRANRELAALKKMPNTAATALLIKAAQALLTHLVRLGVKRLIARRKRKT